MGAGVVFLPIWFIVWGKMWVFRRGAFFASFTIPY
jgi:hypothetical protein